MEWRRGTLWRWCRSWLIWQSVRWCFFQISRPVLSTISSCKLHRNSNSFKRRSWSTAMLSRMPDCRWPPPTLIWTHSLRRVSTTVRWLSRFWAKSFGSWKLPLGHTIWNRTFSMNPLLLNLKLSRFTPMPSSSLMSWARSTLISPIKLIKRCSRQKSISFKKGSDNKRMNLESVYQNSTVTSSVSWKDLSYMVFMSKCQSKTHLNKNHLTPKAIHLHLTPLTSDVYLRLGPTLPIAQELTAFVSIIYPWSKIPLTSL